MTALPTLFISHGSPMLAIQNSPAHQFLKGLGDDLPRPTGILVASAHWQTMDGPSVNTALKPETMHDFGGFPKALFEIEYPVQGASAMALHAAELLQANNFNVKVDVNRGLDHGAWVPLSLMYPDASIPVAQLSILLGAGPQEHLRMGQAISQLRNEGVLVIGSGSLTHNLYEYRGHNIDAAVPSWVSDFDMWMKQRLETNDVDALLNYRQEACFAKQNHPTDEHILPLFVAMGAAGENPDTKQIHASYEYGVLAMDIYAFE